MSDQHSDRQWFPFEKAEDLQTIGIPADPRLFDDAAPRGCFYKFKIAGRLYFVRFNTNGPHEISNPDFADAHPKSVWPAAITVESAKKRAAFLEALEQYGFMSPEALHAASDWEYQRSYLDQATEL